MRTAFFSFIRRSENRAAAFASEGDYAAIATTITALHLDCAATGVNDTGTAETQSVRLVEGAAFRAATLIAAVTTVVTMIATIPVTTLFNHARSRLAKLDPHILRLCRDGNREQSGEQCTSKRSGENFTHNVFLIRAHEALDGELTPKQPKRSPKGERRGHACCRADTNP